MGGSASPQIAEMCSRLRHRPGNTQKTDKSETKKRASHKNHNFLHEEFCSEPFATQLGYFLTVCQNIHGGSSSKGKAGCGEESSPCGEGVHRSI